jgi:diaminopimelate epimerase
MMKFTKMHGAGNDYVYVNCFEEKIAYPEKIAIYVSDRHKGIGSDGLVLIMPSETCDFRMRMFNSDGSEAQMCGNASRCVGKYVYDNGLTTKTELSLETKAGVKYLQLFPVDGKIQKVRVDMGEPILKSWEVPVRSDQEILIGHPVNFNPEHYAITCVSMGNPHAIIFIDEDVKGFPLEGIGRKVENHSLFPERTNVEFVNVLTPVHATMRVWERGAGETQACGTGACAVLVAGVLNSKLDRKAVLSLPGGDLEIEWNEKDNHVYMTGGAVTVFKGEIDDVV